VCRRSGGEVDTDQDVEHGSAEGTDSPDQRSDGGDDPAAVSDQRGDRRIRDGQSPEREECLADDPGLAQLGEATDMVLLELGDDRGPDVAYGTAGPIQSGARSLLRADLEPGQPVVRGTLVIPPGKWAGSVTEARSCPVPDSTGPSSW
jgi:hypothetical protein